MILLAAYVAAKGGNNKSGKTRRFPVRSQDTQTFILFRPEQGSLLDFRPRRKLDKRVRWLSETGLKAGSLSLP